MNLILFLSVVNTIPSSFESEKLRNTPRTEGLNKVQGSVNPGFVAGLPFPVPPNQIEILEF